jgi:hypothetical protein
VYADVAPPPGQKSVRYFIEAKGLAAFSDRVLLAYPCGTSSGAPDRVLRLLEEGKKTEVGRRGGDCKLYGAQKADYDRWAAENPGAGQGSFTNDAADAFVNTLVACAGGVTPVFVLKESDPRTEVVETITVKALDGSRCEVTTAVAGGVDNSSTTGTTGGSTAGAAKSGCSVRASSRGPTSAAAPFAGPGLDGDGAGGRGSWAFGMGALATVLTARLRRRGRGGPRPSEGS